MIAQIMSDAGEGGQVEIRSKSCRTVIVVSMGLDGACSITVHRDGQQYVGEEFPAEELLEPQILWDFVAEAHDEMQSGDSIADS